VYQLPLISKFRFKFAKWLLKQYPFRLLFLHAEVAVDHLAVLHAEVAVDHLAVLHAEVAADHLAVLHAEAATDLN